SLRKSSRPSRDFPADWTTNVTSSSLAGPVRARDGVGVGLTAWRGHRPQPPGGAAGRGGKARGGGTRRWGGGGGVADMAKLPLRNGKGRGGARRPPRLIPVRENFSAGVFPTAKGFHCPGACRLVDPSLEPPEHLGGVVHQLQPGRLAPAAAFLEGQDV